MDVDRLDEEETRMVVSLQTDEERKINITNHDTSLTGLQ